MSHAWLCGVATLLVLLGAAPRAIAAPADTLEAGVAALIAGAGKVPEKERLHRLFRLHAQYLFEEYPEYATYVGVRGHNGRWSDYAPAAIVRRKVAIESPARALATIDRTKLSAAD